MNRVDECNGSCEDGNGVVLKIKMSGTQFRHPLIFIRLTSLKPFNTIFSYYFYYVASVISFGAQFKASLCSFVIYSDGSKIICIYHGPVTWRNTVLTSCVSVAYCN